MMRNSSIASVVTSPVTAAQPGAGDQSDPGGPCNKNLNGNNPWRGEEHADHRGKDDERHHARLGERVAGAQLLREALGKDLGIHRKGRKPRKAKKFSTTSEISRSAAPAL